MHFELLGRPNLACKGGSVVAAILSRHIKEVDVYPGSAASMISVGGSEMAVLVVAGRLQLSTSSRERK